MLRYPLWGTVSPGESIAVESDCEEACVKEIEQKLWFLE